MTALPTLQGEFTPVPTITIPPGLRRRVISFGLTGTVQFTWWTRAYNFQTAWHSHAIAARYISQTQLHVVSMRTTGIENLGTWRIGACSLEFPGNSGFRMDSPWMRRASSGARIGMVRAWRV